MQATKTDLWLHTHAEREALLELLETLEPQQWDHPTLCAGWRVRDAVAHLVATTEIKLPSALIAIARSGFRMNAYIDREARRLGSAPVDELLDDFRAALPRTNHPPAQSAVAMLEDIVIHQIDIRKPLGLARAVPPERLKLTADYLDGNGFYPAKNLARGLRLEANDTDWSTGDGPVVRGPLEALVLMLSGRFIEIDQLTGDGLANLTSRIAATTYP